jgi:hypothetical protein
MPSTLALDSILAEEPFSFRELIMLAGDRIAFVLQASCIAVNGIALAPMLLYVVYI